DQLDEREAGLTRFLAAALLTVDVVPDGLQHALFSPVKWLQPPLTQARLHPRPCSSARLPRACSKSDGAELAVSIVGHPHRKDKPDRLRIRSVMLSGRRAASHAQRGSEQRIDRSEALAGRPPPHGEPHLESRLVDMR